MNDYILYQQHIMWYESKMITETLDSLQTAISHSKIPIKLLFCFNSQTYIESPVSELPEKMFLEFINHPILKTSIIINKTNSDNFFNIADFRRDYHDPNAKYTIWGESDCLLPNNFFYIINNISIENEHILSFASRKMWDDSWNEVEHKSVQQYPRYKNSIYNAPKPYNSSDIINQHELDMINDSYDNIEIIKLKKHKIDGSLLCIKKGICNNFIPKNMHFVREDTCAEKYFEKNNIPQYHVTNIMKGHNYTHPLKRTNTNNTRNDEIFKHYKNESENVMYEFINNL